MRFDACGQFTMVSMVRARDRALLAVFRSCASPADVPTQPGSSRVRCLGILTYCLIFVRRAAHTWRAWRMRLPVLVLGPGARSVAEEVG